MLNFLNKRGRESYKNNLLRQLDHESQLRAIDKVMGGD